MRSLQLFLLCLLMLNGILGLAALGNSAQSGHVYANSYPQGIQRASGYVFLCSDDGVAVFSNMLFSSSNPLKDRPSIKVEGAERVVDYDIKGRLVRKLELSDGETIWDVKDGSGRTCPSGVYLLNNANRRNQARKISKIN
jgi:hypothetical protein